MLRILLPILFFLPSSSQCITASSTFLSISLEIFNSTLDICQQPRENHAQVHAREKRGDELIGINDLARDWRASLKVETGQMKARDRRK